MNYNLPSKKLEYSTLGKGKSFSKPTLEVIHDIWSLMKNIYPCNVFYFCGGRFFADSEDLTTTWMIKKFDIESACPKNPLNPPMEGFFHLCCAGVFWSSKKKPSLRRKFGFLGWWFWRLWIHRFFGVHPAAFSNESGGHPFPSRCVVKLSMPSFGKIALLNRW